MSPFVAMLDHSFTFFLPLFTGLSCLLSAPVPVTLYTSWGPLTQGVYFTRLLNRPPPYFVVPPCHIAPPPIASSTPYGAVRSSRCIPGRSYTYLTATQFNVCTLRLVAVSSPPLLFVWSIELCPTLVAFLIAAIQLNLRNSTRPPWSIQLLVVAIRHDVRTLALPLYLPSYRPVELPLPLMQPLLNSVYVI
jgi:hypothetical protein